MNVVVSEFHFGISLIHMEIAVICKVICCLLKPFCRWSACQPQSRLLSKPLLFASVAVVNLKTNRCVRMLGKPENARFLHLALFQGTANKPKAALTIDMEASDNPILKGIRFDPTLFCTAFKKNRFYMFTTREPIDTKGSVACIVLCCFPEVHIIPQGNWN